MYQIIITLDSSLDNSAVDGQAANTLSPDQVTYLNARSNAQGFISSNTVFEGTKTITTHTWNSRQDYENFVIDNSLITVKAGFGRDRQYNKRHQIIEVIET